MTQEDPRLLKLSGETPAEIASALRALHARDRDGVRLARVAERLCAALETSPAPHELSALNGAKIALTALALGGGLLGYTMFGGREAPPANAQVTATATANAPANSPQPEPIRPHAVRIAPAEQPTEAPPPAAAAAPRRPPRAARAAQPRARDGQPTASAANRSDVQTTTAAAPPEPPLARFETEHEHETEPATEHEHAKNTIPAPEVPSEITLLQRARRTAPQQPAAALALLGEHAQHYPAGMLAPERELLTIEVLRALGRGPEAAVRQRQFESRYPRSIYLRRLHRTPAPQM